MLVYCVILCEQFNRNSYNGILVYIKKYNLLKVKVTKPDLISVVNIRNRLAKLHKKLKEDTSGYKNLPDLYSNSFECKTCYVREVCFFHYKNSENRSKEQIEDYIKRCTDLGIGIENKVLYDIDKDLVTYFNYHMNLINQEEVYVIKDEKKNIILNKDNDIDLTFYECFKIEKLSDNPNSINLSIVDIQSNFRQEDLSKNLEILNEGYSIYYKPNNKTYFGIVESRQLNNNRLILNLNILKKNMFKSKSEFTPGNEIFLKPFSNSSFGFKLMRGNLISMILNQKSKVISDIVHLSVPSYNIGIKDYIIKFITQNFPQDFKFLNTDQKHAILKCLLTENYSLIVGYPGSGKTTIIALLIEILVSMGKKVLIAAYTNTAVDNILIKLKERGFYKFKRLSNSRSVVNPGILDFVLKSEDYESPDEIKKELDSISVYACTSHGISHKVLPYVKFDFCVIDEACQIFEPLLLGPLLFVDKFVLVGDPYQVSIFIIISFLHYLNHVKVRLRLYSKDYYTSMGIRLFI